MSKTIYNNNYILKSTAINYDSFVRIAKILRPSNISFKIMNKIFNVPFDPIIENTVTLIAKKILEQEILPNTTIKIGLDENELQLVK